MKTRAVMLRGVALVAALALGGGILQAGPATPEPVVRREAARIGQLPSDDLSIAREAAYQHLKLLGIPPADLQAAFERLGSEAAHGRIDASAIEGIAALATDYEGYERSRTLLTAYAEMVAFGAPQSYDFDAQGIEPILAANPVKDWTPEELAQMEADAGAAPKIGGVCSGCPGFDFGPMAFAPVGTYAFDSQVLAGAGDCVWYAFNVVANRQYEFTVCSPGSAAWDSVIELYNPASSCVQPGGRIAFNDDCQTTPTPIRQSRLLWDATYTGQVLLKLRGFAASTVTGAYTLAYRDNGITCETCLLPPVALATPVAVPQSVSGSTNANCPSKFYAVNLVAGGVYRFTTCPNDAASAPICGLGTADYDTRILLYTPACGVITSNDDSCTTAGQTSRSTLNYTAVSAGTHVVQVTGRQFSSGLIATGNYTMCYFRLDQPCANCAAGPYEASLTPTLACQDTGTRTVDACQDDWYQFNLTAGKTYEFTTCNVSGGCTTGTSTFDTILDLYSPGCGLVTSDDDGCGFPRSKVTYTALVNGQHKLLVRGKSSATGSYVLTYRELVGPACVPPTSITPWVASGNVTAPGCSRLETFSLSVDAAATTPITYNWTITPPGTGSASPSFGTATGPSGSGAPASFSSNLTGEGIYIVNVTASNGCGSTSRGQNYVLADPVPPSITAPANASVACNAVPPATNPPASDNCDPAPTVTFSEVRTNGPCQDTYTLTRTWTARDRSNNATSAVQTIAVSDTVAPTLAGVPANATVACNAIPPVATVTASDSCDPAPTVTFNETRANGSCPGNYTLTRTWTARDRCNNTRSGVQVIQVSDAQGPVLAGVPANATVECDAVPPPAAVTATDACDPNPSLTFNETRVNGSCAGNYTLTRTWTATDWCGNATTRTQVVTVVDTTPPVITATSTPIACLWPPNHSYACFGSAALLAGASVSDNCSLPVSARITGVTVMDSAADRCGDGNIDPDYEISADGASICVQAERCGNDMATTGGRTYSIEAAAVDACGNESAPVSIGTIFVPHDHRAGLNCQRADQRRLGP